MALTKPASPTVYTTQYANLKGVNYLKDQTQIDRWHSPDMLNMISNNGGDPVKRLGWRKVLADTGIIDFIPREESGVPYIYILKASGVTKHSYDNPSSYTSVIVSPFEGYGFTDCSFVEFNGDLVLFASCNGYNCIYKIANDGTVKTLKIGDGTHRSMELDTLYIPTITLSRLPDGSSGTSLDDVNLLTRYRTISFLNSASAKDFYLYESHIRNDDANKYVLADSIRIKVVTAAGDKVLTDDEWSFIEATTTISGFDEAGKVKEFTVAPASFRLTTAYPPLLKGQDSVEITFIPFNNEDFKIGEVTSKRGIYYARNLDVMKPRASTIFGYQAIDRCFIAGGRELNTVYYSDVNDITYFPDLNYITIGQSTNGIVGFHRMGSYLLAFKDDGADESTSFLIQGYTYDEGGVSERSMFGVTPMTNGIGALAQRTFSTLNDEPLFLSRTGIYGLVSTYTATEKNVENRSGNINRRLLAEENLEKACACTWNNYYLLAINSHIYILDGRQKTSDSDGGSSYFYEAYYWEGVPAKVMRSHHGDLWFADEDGSLCRFNTDIKGCSAYCDDGQKNGSVMEGGKAIHARWTSKLDEDYRLQYLKTMNKKGAVLTIAPYEKTSVVITLVKDGVQRYELDPFHVDISDWDNVDYDTFTISTSNIAQDKFFKKKLKKYKRIQVIAENYDNHEPFGVIGMTRTYTINDLAKK